jgi:mRNA-degrading endonuclease RelE of RelBE toxin-antitoxin system
MPSLMSKPLLICYLILATMFPLNTSGTVFHPFHISSTDVNYNAKTNTLEISCRIFTDDFELALANNFKVKTDLSAAAKHKAMDGLVRKYVLANFSLNANGKPLPLNYLGFEKDNEATIVYLESEPFKGLKRLETTNSVLYDQFDDQANIIHVTGYGKRKSAKVDYPNKKIVSEL